MEVCEEDGSEAGERGKKGEACEGGEEVGGAGGCIAACKLLASRRPAADASADPLTSWSPSCESISLGVCASTSPPAPKLARVSVCRRVRAHPRQATGVEPPTATASARPRGRLALSEVCRCPSGGLTERRKAAATSRTRRKGACARTNASPVEAWDQSGRVMWTERETEKR